MNLLRFSIVFLTIIFHHFLYSQQNSYYPPTNFEIAGKFFGGLHPIGWSQNESYFAWARYNIDTGEADPPEGYFFVLQIQDLRSDTIVYEKKIYGNEFCGKNDCDFSIEAIWKEYEDLFHTKLKEYKIIKEKIFNWKEFPFDFNEQTYDISLNKENNEILNERVSIINNKLGTKLIFNKKYEEGTSPIHSEISGTFISPLFKRLVVVKKSKYPGFEEARLLVPTLIGCHMTLGYK